MCSELEEDVLQAIDEGISCSISNDVYSLRQASRQWQGKFKRCLLALGFE